MKRKNNFSFRFSENKHIALFCCLSGEMESELLAVFLFIDLKNKLLAF
jgi:hypothetical protein